MALLVDNPKPFARNKTIASAVLLAMTCVFIITLLIDTQSNWILFVRSVAEAGMIGGLADWFAVEALFRHPLGIPIPHTALLPKGKKRAARNLSQFIRQHFLRSELIKDKISKANIAPLMIKWLTEPKTLQFIANKAASVVQKPLKQGAKIHPPVFVRNFLHQLIIRTETTDFLRKQVDHLVRSDLRHEITDYALKLIRSLVEKNDQNITEAIHERSRWWIASGVDRRISKALVGEVVSVINTLLDRNSDLRAEFDAALVRFATDHKQNLIVTKTIKSLILRFVDGPDFDDFITTFVTGLQKAIKQDVDQGTGQVSFFIQDTITALVHLLEENPKEIEKLNEDIAGLAGHIVTRFESVVTNFIYETILSWDEDELVELIENEVGNDLQFIRINGTVLGGFIGGILFLVEKMIQMTVS